MKVRWMTDMEKYLEFDEETGKWKLDNNDFTITINSWNKKLEVKWSIMTMPPELIKALIKINEEYEIDFEGGEDE